METFKEIKAKDLTKVSGVVAKEGALTYLGPDMEEELLVYWGSYQPLSKLGPDVKVKKHLATIVHTP